MLQVIVSQSLKDDDRHALVYHAGYTAPQFPKIIGAIIDNERDTPIKLIEPQDREVTVENGHSVYAARDVFDSLFPGASCVRVDGVWLMRKLM